MNNDNLEKRTFYIETFGCQMNDRDSQRIAGVLLHRGLRPISDIKKADLIIMNTCTIRKKAEDKAKSLLGRLKTLKTKNPRLILAMGGCLAQQEGEQLHKNFPQLNIIFGTHQITNLPDMIERVEGGCERLAETSFHYNGDSRFTSYDPHDFHIFSPGEISAYITIMEGCNNYCRYCVVPYVRGREITRSKDEILEEIRNMVALGVKEVTLIGQNVNSYGHFPDLLQDINDIEGLFRIRFTTSHPKDISPSLINCFGSLEKLCEHMHLPAQSGSDRVLNLMNRGYTHEEYIDKIRCLRDKCPGISITTDLMVGFPGEEESDFEQTLEIVREIMYDNIFAFRYSARPHTEASTLPDQVADGIKSRRLSQLLDLQRRITEEKNKAMVGRRVEVLVEGRSKKGNNSMFGKTRGNTVVNFSGGEDLVGQLVSIEVHKGLKNSLLGTVVDRN